MRGWEPGHIAANKGSYPSLSTAQLDASGEYCGAVLRAPKAGNIAKVGIRTGTVTTADPINLRLETVDASNGQPTGTLIDTNAYGQVAAPESNTTYWVSLAASVSVTRLQEFAIKSILDYTDGNLQIAYALSSNIHSANYPYAYTYLNGSFAQVASPANYALEYDDGSIEYVFGAFPAVNLSIPSFNSGSSTYNRAGLRFRKSYAFKADGLIVYGTMAGDHDIILYDSDGTTILEQLSFDKDKKGGTLYNGTFFPFSQKRTFSANTYHRGILVPTTTTSVALPYYEAIDDGSNLAMNGMPGGTDFHWTQCLGAPTGEASWTQYINRCPAMAIQICGVPASSSGALLTHPGMNGGCNA